MEKFKLIQKLHFDSRYVSYTDVLFEAKELKNRIQDKLVNEGLENDFEVIVSIEDYNNSILITSN